MDGLLQLAKINVFCVDSTAYQPLKDPVQPSNLESGLQSSILISISHPHHFPTIFEHLCHSSNSSDFLLCGKLYKQLQVLGKCNKVMHLWQVIMAHLMCDLNQFSQVTLFRGIINGAGPTGPKAL